MDTNRILEQARSLNGFFQRKQEDDFSYDRVSGRLSEIVEGDSFILSSEGIFLGFASRCGAEDFPRGGKGEGERSRRLTEQETRRLEDLEETFCGNGEAAGMFFQDNEEGYISGRYHALIPIRVQGMHLGTLWLNRRKAGFSEREILMGEYTAVLVGLEMDGKKRIHDGGDRKRRAAARQAFATLTGSERSALKHIFEKLREKDEVLVVASKTAEALGIGRTTVANAISKAAGAGMIQTSSCGTKGTSIRILNETFRHLAERG